MELPRRCFIFLLLAALCVPGLSRPKQAGERVESLVTHGGEQGQFLAVVERARKSDGTYLPVSVVQFRPLGGGPDAWREYAQFDARVLALGVRAGDLAVLLEVAESGVGRTQIRYVHNSMEGASRASDVGGPPLPAGVTAIDLAGGSGGGPLLALGFADGQSSVFALAGTQWEALPPLPEAVASLGEGAIDLGSAGRRAVVAARVAPDSIQVLVQEDDGWRDLGRIAASPDEQWQVINGGDLARPMMYLWGEGDRIVQFEPADAAGAAEEQEAPAARSVEVDYAPPPALEVSLRAEDPRTAAMALGSVRLLRATASRPEKGAAEPVLLELALDPVSLAPIGEGAVAITFSSISEEMREQMVTLLLYGLLVIAVIAVLRQRPLPPADRLREVVQQLAPLSLRCVAGLVDGLPLALSAAAWWLLEERVGTAWEWLIILSGLLVYFGHVTAAEAATGKSLGKALFGLKVVRTDGSEAGPGAILLRNLLRPLDVPTAGLGLAWLNPLRQRLGDIAAGTTVVRTGGEGRGQKAEGRNDG